LTDFYNFLIQGGPVMWPLLLSAIISIVVMIERSIALSKASSNNDELIAKVKTLLLANNADEALKVCEATSGPSAALLAGGIRNRHLDNDAIERAMEELALRETPALYRRLAWLDTIITVAPLLGLLGTVTGMIKAFHVVGGPGGISAPTAITSGVAEALYATATGLGIAIVTLIGYNALSEKVKTIVADMEVRATQLLNILANRKD
jgi:biopolymer transport protein ExbB